MRSSTYRYRRVRAGSERLTGLGRICVNRLAERADNTGMSAIVPRLAETDAARARRKVLCTIGALALIVGVGTVGLMLTEAWSAWRALYFTIITITTVGYGDYGISETGERLTLFVMLGGIGVMTYTVTQIVPQFLDIRRNQERHMYKAIMQLSDHYIVCGLGRMGRTVCETLAAQEISFVALDQSERAVQWAIAEGYLAMVGDATDDDMLEAANIHSARGLACVASRDTDNIVITLSAHTLNPELFIISRSEEDESNHKLRRAGASVIVSPTQKGGESIASALRNPELAHFYQYSIGTVGDFGLIEVNIGPGSSLEQSSMKQLYEDFGDITFVAMRRFSGETALRPGADVALRAGDTLIVAGQPRMLASLDAASRTEHCKAA